MITKADLKIEAARLAMEAVDEAIEKGQKIEFTPLAEEIYAFLEKDLNLKDTDNPEDLVSKMNQMLGQSNWGNIPCQTIKSKEDGTEDNKPDSAEKA